MPWRAKVSYLVTFFSPWGQQGANRLSMSRKCIMSITLLTYIIHSHAEGIMSHVSILMTHETGCTRHVIDSCQILEVLPGGH